MLQGALLRDVCCPRLLLLRDESAECIPLGIRTEHDVEPIPRDSTDSGVLELSGQILQILPCEWIERGGCGVSRGILRGGDAEGSAQGIKARLDHDDGELPNGGADAQIQENATGLAARRIGGQVDVVRVLEEGAVVGDEHGHPERVFFHIFVWVKGLCSEARLTGVL